MTLSLFRMIDICEGEIYVDEKDTKRVPLEELRSKLAIIPQDPVLFTGTIRSVPINIGYATFTNGPERPNTFNII